MPSYGPPGDQAEKDRRRPMWVALSDLYLDTMMTPGAISHIVRTAREQGFDAWDLRQMLLYEVGPVVFWNCYVVAGVWDMFNEDWLIRKIERNWRRPFHRFRCRLKRRAIFDPVEADFDRVLRELARAP